MIRGKQPGERPRYRWADIRDFNKPPNCSCLNAHLRLPNRGFRALGRKRAQWTGGFVMLAPQGMTDTLLTVGQDKKLCACHVKCR